MQHSVSLSYSVVTEFFQHTIHVKIYLKRNLKRGFHICIIQTRNEKKKKSNEVERPKLIPEALAKFP